MESFSLMGRFDLCRTCINNINNNNNNVYVNKHHRIPRQNEKNINWALRRGELCHIVFKNYVGQYQFHLRHSPPRPYSTPACKCCWGHVRECLQPTAVSLLMPCELRCQIVVNQKKLYLEPENSKPVVLSDTLLELVSSSHNRSFVRSPFEKGGYPENLQAFCTGKISVLFTSLGYFYLQQSKWTIWVQSYDTC